MEAHDRKQNEVKKRRKREPTNGGFKLKRGECAASVRVSPSENVFRSDRMTISVHLRGLNYRLYVCVWKREVLMAVFCRRRADRGSEVSVSEGVTVGMRSGQIRGKYFSINSFTAAIS